MALTIASMFKYFSAFCIITLVLVLESECKGGRSGGGGRSSSHSSGGHSSGHSSGGHSYGSHSSHSSSYGGSHSSYDGGSHTNYGGGSHTNYGSGYHSGYDSPSHSYGTGSVSHTGGAKPIGFDHVNQQAHNSLNGGRTGIGFDHVNSQAARPYHPYNPQTFRQSGGYVHYQPPTQLQYTPPVSTVHHTSTHYVPVYQPTVIHSHSGSDSTATSFLGGYLVGRMTSGGHSHSSGTTHVTNNYYNSDNDVATTGNSYYTVHHFHQNPEKVPSRFSVPGDDLTECEGHITDSLCVPNTNAFCLKNGTIMCTTPSVLTSPCGDNTTANCVYSKIPCTPAIACNVTSNQTFVDFYLPCIANVTYVNNRVFDSNYIAAGSYELCVTAIAHPRKLESPFGAVANLLTEFGKWHLQQLIDIHNMSTPSNNIIT